MNWARGNDMAGRVMVTPPGSGNSPSSGTFRPRTFTVTQPPMALMVKLGCCNVSVHAFRSISAAAMRTVKGTSR